MIPARIETPLAAKLGIRYPILCAPMFLISNVDMLVAVGEAGAIAAVPSPNFRTTDELRAALVEIRRRTAAPFGVNLILKAPRLDEDLAACVEARVPLLITSLGDPSKVIAGARAIGAQVWCDVIDLGHARRAEAAGADAVIAVASGAGGHGGRISPFVLVPWLRQELRIPVVAAGGIATGAGVAAALALGADLAYIGTRFIASVESPADAAHKEMILRSTPEDVETTAEVTGTPGNFLRESLETFRTGGGKAWKAVYSAGQNVGLIRSVKTCAEIVEELVEGYLAARAAMPS
ncbi:MAG TPA: nitronate monooxygenase [Haliangiales bacterium]|nr:nitronate monooxygenase [Haliangiales bacterium]